jgi:ABC-type polysaccharide/polyol phosphate transport system ATPase subunit
VAVEGRLASLIELGAGFHPDFSGRENIVLNGIVLGMSRSEVEQRFDAIVDFAELGDFIDEPVRTYSTGMYMRLGFSIAVHVDPDVLLLDEVLSVGDEAFAAKCQERLSDFQRRGKTMLMVTHDLGAVEGYCSHALRIGDGVIADEGDPAEVAARYRAEVARRSAEGATS